MLKFVSLLSQVPTIFAHCLGLPDGLRVGVRARRDVVDGDMIMVEPANEDEWEILELNKDYIEDQLLTQVRLRSRCNQAGRRTEQLDVTMYHNLALGEQMR